VSFKAWDIIAYTYNGSFYCIACTRKMQRLLERKMCVCAERDKNGICAANCTGYGPNPVFASDRGELDNDFCGACSKQIQ
jgi:hypothetical protein